MRTIHQVAARAISQISTSVAPLISASRAFFASGTSLTSTAKESGASSTSATEASSTSSTGTAEAPDASQPRQGILLNTMPKSGSIYVAMSLKQILGLDFMYLGNGYALIDQIGVQNTQTFSGGGFVSQNHLAPSPVNLQILQHFKLKMILHLRDPRQALLSWVHHLDWVTSCSDRSPLLLYFAPRTPPGYFEFSLSRKIDWQIENYLPQLIAWTEGWVEIADRGTLPILITHQNDLRSNEKAFFDAILVFYQFDLGYALPNLPKTRDGAHFRLADPTEWRRTFTPDQAARSTLEMPHSLRMRFGWDD
jgi:hypothetical protein